jgi:hypothetical protein
VVEVGDAHVRVGGLGVAGVGHDGSWFWGGVWGGAFW